MRKSSKASVAITEISDLKMRKLASLLLVSLLIINITQFTVFASISVGVKESDWIQYNVTYTGTPPEGHGVTWAKMEGFKVQGAVITVRIISKLSNQQQENRTMELNLATGHLVDAFIIPAGLETGETFLDENKGLVTINGTILRTVARRERTVVYVTTPETITYWDKETGVAVEGFATFTNFTMITKTEETNMWDHTAAIQDRVICHTLLGIALAVSLGVLAFVVLRGRK